MGQSKNETHRQVLPGVVERSVRRDGDALVYALGRDFVSSHA